MNPPPPHPQSLLYLRSTLSFADFYAFGVIKISKPSFSKLGAVQYQHFVIWNAIYHYSEKITPAKLTV